MALRLSPRLATSVAIRIFALFSLNALMVLFLSLCLISPWIAKACSHISSNLSVSSSVATFVCVKISNFWSLCSSMYFASTSSFLSHEVMINIWSIFDETASGVMEIWWYSDPIYLSSISLSSWVTVAENDINCFMLVQWDRIYSTSSLNHISSILSASSRTK